MGQRWETGRVEAFSDGVFAIAITLLVLDIHVPAVSFDDLWAGIADQWPAYLAYVTSFLAIGGVWMQHHGLFGSLRFVDSMIMRLNLALLMVVAFLPFPTGLMAEAITHSRSAERAAVVLYGATLLVITLLIGTLWRHAAARRTLLHEDIIHAAPDAGPGASLLSRVVLGERQQLRRLALYGVAVAVGVFLLPRLAAFAYLAVAVESVASARGDRPPGRTGREEAIG